VTECDLKIALAGGGGADDSALIDRRFAAWIPSGETLLYIPIALRWQAPEYSEAYAWLSTVFRPLGIDRIAMWTGLDDHRGSELARYAAVYIGGGNTYYLLARMRQSGMVDELVHFARDGGPIYGGSAGAVVLGRDIATVAHLDTNEVDLSDTAGLDLAHGSAVWVHYTEADDPLIEHYVAGSGQRLVVLTERSGVTIEGDAMWSVGWEPAYIVDQAGRQALPAHSV
jgi:dipeptidase E